MKWRGTACRAALLALLMAGEAVAICAPAPAPPPQKPPTQVFGKLLRVSPTEIAIQSRDSKDAIVVLITGSSSLHAAKPGDIVIVHFKWAAKKRIFTSLEVSGARVNAGEGTGEVQEYGKTSSNIQAAPLIPISSPTSDPSKAPVGVDPQWNGEQTAKVDTPPNSKPRIAILDFDYASVKSSTSAIFGSDVDVGKGISGLLASSLVNDGQYTVVESSAWRKILAEQNLVASDLHNRDNAVRLGKLLDVDLVLIGDVTHFDKESEHSGTTSVGSKLGGFGGKTRTKTSVELTARLVDTHTGEIISFADGLGTASQSSGSSVAALGEHTAASTADNLSFESSAFQKTLVGQSTTSAIDDLKKNLYRQHSNNAVAAAASSEPATGTIVSVDGSQIVLNIGSKAGVKAGDQFNVLRVTREIRDPETGAAIRKLTSAIGVIRVTDVDDASAVGIPVSGADFKTGDRVTVLSHPPDQ